MLLSIGILVAHYVGDKVHCGAISKLLCQPVDAVRMYTGFETQ